MRGRERMFSHFSSDMSEPLSLTCWVSALRSPHAAAAESSHGTGQVPARTAAVPSPLDTPAAARELPADPALCKAAAALSEGCSPLALTSRRREPASQFALPPKDGSEKQPFIRLLGRYILQNQPAIFP